MPGRGRLLVRILTPLISVNGVHKSHRRRGRSAFANAVISLAFTILGGPGILGVLLPALITHWRVSPSPIALRVLAWALVVIGLVPLLESIARFVWSGRGTLVPFAPTETLVGAGFYRWVRNPMYVGVLSGIAGQAILFQSLLLAGYAFLVALGFHLVVTLYEEPTLQKQFGASYEEFSRRVCRWLPRIPSSRR